MVERAVVNASPLILLSRAGHLHLPQAVSKTLLVPAQVVTEVRAKGEADPCARALAEATWLEQVAVDAVPPAIAAWRLGAGESAVLALASARPGTAAILDDREGRRCATALRIPVFVATLIGWVEVAAGEPVASRPT